MIKQEIINIFLNIGIDLELVDINRVKIKEVCDSLQYVSMLCDIEDEFGIIVPVGLIGMNEEMTIIEFIKEIVSIV